MTKDDFKAKEIMVEDFLKLFDTRDYEDKILAILN